MTDEMPRRKQHAAPRRRKVVAEAPTDTRSVGSEGEAVVEASTPVLEPDESASAPLPSAVRTGAQPMRRIRNLLGQMVTCSVLSEDGSNRSVRLPANGLSDPYPESHITDYTRRLVNRGHLQLVR